MQNLSAFRIIKVRIVKVLLCVFVCVCVCVDDNIYPPNLGAFETERGCNSRTEGVICGCL